MPLIGISADWQEDHRYGADFLRVRPDYSEAIRHSGGIPVILPIITDKDVIQSLINALDGILLSGGGDIDPVLYGASRSKLTSRVIPDRDSFESLLIRQALTGDKPLLAICRGHQMVNVALGGSLYQDIAEEYSPSVQHNREPLSGGFTEQAHRVTITAVSKLAEAMGFDEERSFGVNSLHHQGIKDLAPDLVASAFAEDGLIEGVEIPEARFFVGVQWHPESLYHQDEAMHNLFKAFIQSVR